MLGNFVVIALFFLMSALRGAVIRNEEAKKLQTKFDEFVPTPDVKLLKEDKNFWYDIGLEHLERNVLWSKKPVKNVAKNVIIFLGDGMGLSTITSSRIYTGQRNFGKSGEEHNLSWDKFPNVGLVKTYNVDMQVPDSAGTATALFTGVKVRYEAIGVDVNSNSSVFDESVYEKSKLESIMTWAQRADKDTGIITTTRISHATPAATYSQVNHRSWECDSKIPQKYRSKVKDIARQLVEDSPGRNFKVVLGGGLQQMGYNSQAANDECVRTDGLNLTRTWINLRAGTKARFVTNNEQLSQVDPEDTESLLGLFDADHVPYHLLRDPGPRGTPSLIEMVQKGLPILQKNPNGFVLLVEGGRIDHGHHANYARLAMEEATQLDNAISWVLDQTDDDTLILVTADHSHSLTLNGYGKRGNDILGYGILTSSKKPALTLTYANGQGFDYHFRPDVNHSILGPWVDVRSDPNRLTDPKYRHTATYSLEDETHGGEDVAIYATGPGSHLVRGVLEQNYVAHLVSYAACIGPRAKWNQDCGKGAASRLNVNFSVMFVTFVSSSLGYLLRW